jgi:hypothetical protein
MTKGQKRPFHRGRQCRICTDPRRAEIELMIARGASRRATARHFGDAPGLADAIFRHWKLHVADHVKALRKIEVLKPGEADLDKLVTDEAIGLLGHLQRLRGPLFALFDNCVKAGDAHNAAAVSSQLHKNLQLLALRTGELDAHRGPTINNTILLCPEYPELQKLLLTALRPFPEAARAVADALQAVEATALAQRRGPPPPPLIEGRADAL